MIKPMLAKLEPKAFKDENHIWEIKYDGVRAITVVTEQVRIWGRSGIEKSHQFPELDIQTKAPAILDGEIVCYANGKTEFNAVQHRNRRNNVQWASRQFPATYEVFDILEVKGIDLRGYPLIKRREILDSILVSTPNVRLAAQTDDGVSLYNQAKTNLMEGVIGKRKTGTYQEGYRGWLKVKTWQEGEFLVAGYTAGTGWRAPTFGALVLSDFHGRYVGAVGTGFNDADISMLYNDLSKTQAPCPFPKEPEKATWVKPQLVIKVKFLEYTNDGMLRFPAYKGVVK